MNSDFESVDLQNTPEPPRNAYPTIEIQMQEQEIYNNDQTTEAETSSKVEEDTSTKF